MADDDEKDPSLGSRFKDYLRQNPCVRDAAASGLVGGFFTGFAAFIWTSQPPRGYNWFVGTFIALANIQYFGCKLKRREQERQADMVRRGMAHQRLIEGTDRDTGDIVSPKITTSEGHVPLDELEEFERQAQARQASLIDNTTGQAVSAIPPLPAEPSTPSCDC